MSAVHQVVAGAGRYDAVSEQVRGWRRLLGEWGYGGGDHAALADPRVGRSFAGLERLRPASDDLVVIHYSAWAAGLAPLLGAPGLTLVVYHNVSPAESLWDHSAGLALRCWVARGRLPRVAQAATLCSADSEHNAAELRAAGAAEVRVVPILFESERLRERGTPPAGDGPLVLAVGRLLPHKRHDLILRAFAAYQRECEPGARLLCVGEPLSPAYGRLMDRLARESGARGVTLAGSLAQPQLNAAYASADVLLHLSEHEGFCVPLLEAFHFELPVVTRRAAAVPEVAGDAALYTDGDPAVTAELLDLAVRDTELRRSLAARGSARLEAFSYERTAAAVRELVAAALEPSR